MKKMKLTALRVLITALVVFSVLGLIGAMVPNQVVQMALVAAAEADKVMTRGGGKQFLYFYDEDAMTSDSALGVPSQQSVKAYVDAFTSGLAEGATNAIWMDAGSIWAEGSTKNDYESKISFTNPTADRTFTHPDSSGTYMLSTLATNAPEAANAVTGGTNQLIFECTTANAHELIIQPLDDATTADVTVKVPSLNNANVMVSSLATNDVNIANSVWGVSTGMKFEGSVADAFETTLTVENPTVARTITLPNVTGYVNATLKSDITHVMQSGTTVVDGATLAYTMPDTAGATLEVLCGGTASGTTDAATLTLLGGATVICSIANDAADTGVWQLQGIITVVAGNTVKAHCSLNQATQVENDVGGYTTLTLDVSAVTTWKLQLDLAGSTDDISKEQCIWRRIY